ncbi:hypothetical protein [Arthrobacter sp. HMWF013]|uniref:hypothetical protein n=1 Tax=Arthrobacter sp. HMWF013 TaxID=2056849 RepID=UPI000D3A95F6|nr:hypothetical protein [Arthrobacter sp. HMWF013]PTT68264.1 hypothetical protein DBR22_07010 [Arthrobacter sp. HMWF013]
MSDTAGSPSNTAGPGSAAGSDAGFQGGGFQDGAAVDRLLRDAGMDDDGGLRTALLELRSLSAGQPVPSEAVASLMVPAGRAPRRLAAVAAVARTDAMPTIAGAAVPAPGDAAAVRADAPAAVPVDELAARRRAKRRITLTTLSVAVSLAAGGAVAVASDQGIRDTIGALNYAVTSFVSGTGGASSDKAGQTPSTGPTQPGGTATAPVPGAPAVSGPDAGPATSPEPGTAKGGPAAPATATPGTVPPSGITLPDNLGPGNLVPGADAPGAVTPGHGGPLNGGPVNGGPLDEAAPSLPGQQPLLPLPVTPPASPAPGE